MTNWTDFNHISAILQDNVHEFKVYQSPTDTAEHLRSVELEGIKGRDK